MLARTGHGSRTVLRLYKLGSGKGTGGEATFAIEHGVPGWHSQGITVAYERARGLRAVNQASTGFQVSVSKMVPADMDTALAALRAPARKKWLAGAEPALRRALDGALAAGAKGVVRFPKRIPRALHGNGRTSAVFEPKGMHERRRVQHQGVTPPGRGAAIAKFGRRLIPQGHLTP